MKRVEGVEQVEAKDGRRGVDRDEQGRFKKGNQAAKKRQCLWCRKDISMQRVEAKFCSPSHKALWHREKSKENPIVTTKKNILRRICEVFVR